MLEHRWMQVEVIEGGASGTGADLEAIGLLDSESLPDALQSLPGAGDAKGSFKRTALLRPDSERRVLVVGLGKAGDLDAERLRVAGAVAAKEAARFQASSIAWTLPQEGPGPAEAAAALVEGTVLASYRFDRFRKPGPDDPPPADVERLVLADAPGDELEAAKEEARVAKVVAVAANRARELQDLPANVLNPAELAERARRHAVAFEPLTVEVLGRDRISELDMGGLEAVARGTAAEPQLITVRYAGGSGGATLGLVGKAVTFDSGGISIKPAAKMDEMKMDMSGGSAVLEAMAAIAELGLPLDVVAAIPATENMPSGTATRPGDIITQLNGKTVEVNNTDAEGRLILADALTYTVRELGADRVVDLATLTGAVLVALGSTYAALISNDDEWATAVDAAGDRTGELTWRLPLHPEFKDLTKGKVADLTNSSPKRKAGTIYAGSFLEEFVDDKPWAHLDIAGTAWDVGRDYVGNGPTGYGVRLLVALARELAGAPSP